MSLPAAECIVDINVGQTCKLVCKTLLLLAFCLLASKPTGIRQVNHIDIVVAQTADAMVYIGFDTQVTIVFVRIEVRHFNLYVKLVLQVINNRLYRCLGINCNLASLLVLRTTNVRHKDYFSALGKYVEQGSESCINSVRVVNYTRFNYIVVNSYEYDFAFKVGFLNQRKSVIHIINLF